MPESPEIHLRDTASSASRQRMIAPVTQAAVLTRGPFAPQREFATEATVPQIHAPQWHVWMLMATTAVNVIVAITPRFFPYGDTPNHLARYTLISEAWSRTAPAWVQFRWLPTGYIALDVIGAALVALTSTAVAGRILTAAYVILLPLGTAALLRAVNPRSIGWSLVACLLTFNWYFLEGFLSYSIGVALALLWLAFWWPRRNNRSAPVLAAGAAGIAGLYLVHMAAAAIALTAVGAWCLEPLLEQARTGEDRVHRAVQRVCLTAAYALPALILHALMARSSAFPEPADSSVVFRTPAEKGLHLLAPFVSFSVPEGLGLVLAYVSALALHYAARSSRTVHSSWSMTTAALLLLYVVTPAFLFAAWDVDVRFLLPAYLIAFVATTSEASRPAPSLAVVVLAAASLLHAGETGWQSRRIDADIERVLRLLRPIPRNANTLILFANEGDLLRLDPFRHIGEWLTIRHSSARVNGLFSGGPNGAYLGHFLVASSLYDPGVEWAHEGFPALAWSQVRQDYDYVVLVGRSDQAARRIRAGATPIAIRDAGTLYRVERAAISRVGDRPTNEND